MTAKAYDWLYELMVDPEHSWRWRFRGATPSPELFAAALWRDTLTQFILVERSDRIPLGLVQAYSADLRNRHAYIAVILRSDLQQTGWPFEGVIRFIDLVFSNWDFHKLYFDALAFNADTFDSLNPDILKLECTLPDHARVRGHWVAQHTYALYRDTWVSNERVARVRTHFGLCQDEASRHA